MGIACNDVEERLARHGYTVVHRTAEHSLYEHHGDHVVIPHHSRELSTWTARMIEWSLEPRLGRGWLTTAPELAAGPRARGEDHAPPTRLALTLVVRAEPGYRAWDAFVVEEPRILTFGTTLAETRRRAADAAAAWFGDRAELALEQSLQLDAPAQQWLDHALTPAPSASRAAEARHQLKLMGMADDDIAELLTPSWVGEPA